MILSAGKLGAMFMGKKAKLFVGAIVVVGVVSALGFSHWYAMRLGAANERNIHQQAVIEYQQRIRTMQAELQEAQQRRERVVYRDVEVIRHVQDPTGCADDTTLSDELDRMCSEGNSAAC